MLRMLGLSMPMPKAMVAGNTISGIRLILPSLGWETHEFGSFKECQNRFNVLILTFFLLLLFQIDTTLWPF